MAELLATTNTVEECPVCGASEFQVLSSPGHPIGVPVFGPYLHEFGIFRCSCGLEFTNPRPSHELLSSFYGSRTYDCHNMRNSALAARAARSLLDFIERQGPFSTRKRLLDFGCGGGHFLANAEEAGWSAIGFDIGKSAIETCRSHQIAVTSEFSDLESGGFDVVVLSHVLEHLEEPVNLLRSLQALLAPQGKLIIEVPNVRSARARLSVPALSRWCGFDERHRAFPIHLWYFTPSTLARLLQHSGFQPLVVTTTGIGLEELIRCEPRNNDAFPNHNSSREIANRSRQSSFLRRTKKITKSAFYRMGLGENLLVAARP